MSKVISLAQDLITIASVTPEDAGCQAILIKRLEAMGFDCHKMPNKEISNFWAKRGATAPLFVFAGHTDVVPTGPLHAWESDPFEPEIRDGILYGRGAADMKGALAAMIVATEKFIEQYPEHQGSIGYLITSAEEGPADDGTPFVLEQLKQLGEKIDCCVVGEASSSEVLGDAIKNGRRGSLTGNLKVIGKQGHVAYPHLALNPIHHAMPSLVELTRTQWDQGNEFFPPTSLQISNIQSGTGAGNVIPGEKDILFNLRFSPESSPESLMHRVEAIFNNHDLNYQLDWTLFGEPFLTTDKPFLEACQQAVETICGIKPALKTDGGTSDGRYIAKEGVHVIEFGPPNGSIHQVNEHVGVADLEKLAEVYLQIMINLLTK